MSLVSIMSVSIAEKLHNAGTALLALAEDVFQHVAFVETNVELLFANNSLGGLGRLPPVAEQVVESFMECEGYSLSIYKVLKHYFLNTDFSRVEDDNRRDWYQLIEDVLLKLRDDPKSSFSHRAAPANHTAEKSKSGKKFTVTILCHIP